MFLIVIAESSLIKVLDKSLFIDNGNIINGKKIASSLLTKLDADIEDYCTAHKLSRQDLPRLQIILIGDNHASNIYVRNKLKMAAKISLPAELTKLAADISEADLLATISRLNQEDSVGGIIVQMPLPSHINKQRVIEAIRPDKDVDGFHPVNVGKLSSGINTGLVPCTALGCLHILQQIEPSLSGKHAVIVGRSNIVGRPTAALLLEENCTVTICHSATKDLAAITRQAEIVICAVGKARMFDSSYFNRHAIVIDVGINRDPTSGQLVGDVDFASVKNQVRYISQVPGGVGPMTVAFLLINCFNAILVKPS